MNCEQCGKRPQSCRCGKEPKFSFDPATIQAKVARANRLVDEFEREEAREQGIQQARLAEQAAAVYAVPPVEDVARPLRRPRAPRRGKRRGRDGQPTA